jgi:hypothetical protein
VLIVCGACWLLRHCSERHDKAILLFVGVAWLPFGRRVQLCTRSEWVSAVMCCVGSMRWPKRRCIVVTCNFIKATQSRGMVLVMSCRLFGTAQSARARRRAFLSGRLTVERRCCWESNGMVVSHWSILASVSVNDDPMYGRRVMQRCILYQHLPYGTVAESIAQLVGCE